MKPVARSIAIVQLCVCGASPAQTYDGGFTTLELIPGPHDRALGPLGPATVADPKFDQAARMIAGRSWYAGNHAYKGDGRLVLQATHQAFVFRYTCAYAFVAENETYSARWIVPGKKLEILMSKPRSSALERCRVTTSPPSTSP